MIERRKCEHCNRDYDFVERRPRGCCGHGYREDMDAPYEELAKSRAAEDSLREELLAPTHWESNGEAGDGQQVCDGCRLCVEEQHTWKECAEENLAEADARTDYAAMVEADRDAIQSKLAALVEALPVCQHWETAPANICGKKAVWGTASHEPVRCDEHKSYHLRECDWAPIVRSIRPSPAAKEGGK